MTLSAILFGVFGLGLLMFIHEGGHYLAARGFKMRVTKFSFGFGPALFSHTPKGSPTTYQVALLPVLAYVQIAGMNPLEDIDPEDKGSYANASLLGRISAIFAGPLANYLFASVLFFAAFLVGGREAPPTTRVTVIPNGAAAAAQMHTGDKIVEVAGEPLGDRDWIRMRSLISSHPGQPIVVKVERGGTVVPLTITPKDENGEGRIGVSPEPQPPIPVSVGEAAVLAVREPVKVVVAVVTGIGRMLAGKEKPELSGPVGIVRETARFAQLGLAPFLEFLGVLSAYLGAFNLLPIPALDGGRLMFLAYEATTRKRANPKVEAQVHAVGLLMMVALILVVTWSDIRGHGH